MSSDDKTPCCGCGARFAPHDGPTHDYMLSSPACWAAFGALLDAEYSDPKLMPTHRLSVDVYAVQHPGEAADRRAVQSVGLHLARLMRQLEHGGTPEETNRVMTGFVQHKSTLMRLEPPSAFTMMMEQVAPFTGGPRHAEMVRAWAQATWKDWSAHHAAIRRWAEGR